MQNCACEVDECALCGAEFYSALTAEQVCQIRELLVKKTCKPRTVLFRQGESDSLLFMLRRGLVKLTYSLPDGREQILGLRVAGQLLGFGALRDHAHPYTAETLTDVDLCGIRHQDMLRVLERNPESALRVIDSLNQELQRAQALIRDLGLKSAPERLASFLLSLRQHPDPRENLLAVPLSRREIAELLGLTIETVSRNITRFARKGLIQVLRGHIRIVDLAGLQVQTGAMDVRIVARRELGALKH